MRVRELLPLVPLVDQPCKGMGIPSLSTEPYDDVTRERLACYLETAAMIDPWMSFSPDVLGERFRPVSGGDSVMSDGVWYWRYDAAQYVRHYPIRVPEDALKYFAECGWVPPVFDEQQLQDLAGVLESMFENGRQSDVG